MRNQAALDVRGELGSYFDSVGRRPLLTASEELALARRFAQTREEAVAHRLVEANLRFVVKIALEYRNYGFTLHDLIQEGNVGLVRSVQTFDPGRGFRLISYAVWWIRACIQEYILRNWSLVKIGTTQAQRRLFNRLQSSQRRLERLVDGRCDEGERRAALARAAGCTVEEVEEMERRLYGRDLSLDGHDSDEDGGGLHERLADDSEAVGERLEEEQTQSLFSNCLTGALARLGQREREIVQARHLSERTVTLRELGERLGISKERVRQIENRALAALRVTLSSNAELSAALSS